MAEAARAPPAGRRWLAPASLLLVYLALAIAYQRAVPLFEAPDEPSHVQYLAFLQREGRPPRMQDKPEVPGEGMQPPLYYALLEPLFAQVTSYDPALILDLDQANRWIYRLADLRVVPPGARIRMLGTTQGSGRIFAVDPSLEPLRALRWGSLVFGALAVLLTFDAARRASGSRAFALLCTSLLALSPQFLFVSSYVNNDVACAALGAAAFWLFAHAAARGRVGRGHYIAAASLSAVGLATKLSALPVMAVCALALLAMDRRPLRERLRDVGLAAALGLVLALPSLWMNQARFGGVFGSSALIASSDSLESFDKYGGLRAYLLGVYPIVTFRSYWATFGWLHILAPGWIYLAFLALTAAGALGLAWGWRAAPRALRRYLLATALATLAAHVWLNLHIIAIQGRHLFGAAPQVAALIALGLARLTKRAPFEVNWRTAGAFGAGMLAIALYCLTRVLMPIYG
jgi:hypothetical protein